MIDQDKTKEELLGELADLRQRVAALGTSLAGQQREAELLQQTEARWRSAVANAPTFIAIVDSNGTIQFLNHAQPGLSVEDAIGKTTYAFVHPRFHDAVRGYLQNVFQNGETGFFESVGVGPDGQDAWYETYLGPVKSGEQVVAATMTAMDITERKQAEEALKQAHAQLEERVKKRTAELAKANEDLSVFRTLAEASGQGFGIADLDGRITYANMALRRLIGHGDPLGQSVFTQVPEEHRRQLQEEVFPAVLRDGHWEREFMSRSKSGEEVVTLNSIFLLRDKAGSPAYLADVVTDITERKQAERALEHAHGQLQAIYEGMVDGLLIADVETKEFMRANTSICRMLGYSEEELLSKSVLDIHPPADLPGILESFQALAGGDLRIGVEIPVVRKDGSTFYADVAPNIIEYNGRPCLIGFFRDITEKRRTEEALRHARDQLQSVYDGVLEGLIITDVETQRFVRVNPALCGMLGYSEEELLAASVKDIHPPEEVSNDLARFRAVAEGRVSIHEHRPVLRKDGSIFHADIVARPISYDGRSCTLAIWHDVTERKQAHETLQQQHETLKHLLQSSDHERQLIAYEIHDGLAQQLAGAIMQFDAFDHLKECKPQQAADAYHAGMTMLRQGHFEARRLISGVRPPILDESGVVEAIAHLVHEQGSATKQRIDFHSRVDFDRLVPTLENSIYRIAQEGLTNACQHSKSKQVRVTLLQHGDGVRIEIQDWGIGFDPKAVPKNRFGLEGIRQRTRLLGGKCSIRSSPGKGARLTVELPVVLRE
ncbi:MAG: sensor histidine kinase [Pirellulales bacterium]